MQLRSTIATRKERSVFTLLKQVVHEESVGSDMFNSRRYLNLTHTLASSASFIVAFTLHNKPDLTQQCDY
jgi:hypothetical protein